MLKVLEIILYIPKIIGLGIWKCLNYGNSDQLLLLMCTEAVFIINVKCSKTIGFEDVAILISFISIMHYFSKLEKENLYLQGNSELAKVIMTIINRQNKANKKASRQARDIEKQIKRIGNNPTPPSGGKQGNVFILNIGGGKRPKKEELPKEDIQHELPREDKPNNNIPIIELGQDEYKRVSDEDFGGYLEGGNLE